MPLNVKFCLCFSLFHINYNRVEATLVIQEVFITKERALLINYTETIEAGFLQELLAQGLGYVHLCKYY